jgi:hypothetical protein
MNLLFLCTSITAPNLSFRPERPDFLFAPLFGASGRGAEESLLDFNSPANYLSA